jgi:hypothetical protein
MRAKLLNISLLLSSLLGYLEWGVDQHAFLWQIELDLMDSVLRNPIELLHPMTLIPFTGQLLLLGTLFQHRPGRYLTFIGMGAIGVLLWLIAGVGLMQLNFRMVLSTIPYIIVCMITLRFYRHLPKRQEK